MCKVFDVEGRGLISAAVLERSLRKFDSEVFNEETLQELLGAVPRGPEEQAEEAVNVQAFADFVSAPGPKRQRPRSAEVRSASLHAYMDGLQFDVGSFRQALDSVPSAASADPALDEEGSSDLELVKEDLKKKAKDYVLDVQRRNVLPLWEAFDAGRKGVLQLTDCERLVGAYLGELVPRSDEMVRATVELGIELSVLLFERRNADPAARENMRTQAKLQADALVGKVAPLVREMLERMEREDPRVLAVDLMECLGSDDRGSVSREAFEAHFVEAMRHVLAPERMVERLQKLTSGGGAAPTVAESVDRSMATAVA